MGAQPQAIGLEGQLQAIARLQPEQLAQPGGDHQLSLGGEGEERVHSSGTITGLTSVRRSNGWGAPHPLIPRCHGPLPSIGAGWHSSPLQAQARDLP
jgi:hypothetical protein